MVLTCFRSCFFSERISGFSPNGLDARCAQRRPPCLSTHRQPPWRWVHFNFDIFGFEKLCKILTCSHNIKIRISFSLQRRYVSSFSKWCVTQQFYGWHRPQGVFCIWVEKSNFCDQKRMYNFALISPKFHIFFISESWPPSQKLKLWRDHNIVGFSLQAADPAGVCQHFRAGGFIFRVFVFFVFGGVYICAWSHSYHCIFRFNKDFLCTICKLSFFSKLGSVRKKNMSNWNIYIIIYSCPKEY